MEAYPVVHPTVLLIDDNPKEADIVKWQFESAGFNVIYAMNGKEGLRFLCDDRPDLVLLDVNMPMMDGYDVCQRIREISDIPIVMLSLRSEADAIVKGLTIGADDYVTKPYNKEVLIARVNATLRRAATRPTVFASKETYNDGYLAINLEQRRVLKRGEPQHLSPTEFNLLAILLEASPRVVTYRALLEQVWGFEYIDDIDYLRVYIWHLRNKLEPDSKQPIYILNELSVGYRFQRQT
jgi:DNA-binding response OmpR family regulator